LVCTIIIQGHFKYLIKIRSASTNLWRCSKKQFEDYLGQNNSVIGLFLGGMGRSKYSPFLLMLNIHSYNVKKQVLENWLNIK